jgi:hypothetical protein
MEVNCQLHDPAALSLEQTPSVPIEFLGLVCSKAGLSFVAKRKKCLLCPSQELNPGRPARSLVTILTELHRFFFQKIWREKN